jgi:hypothetical protein
MNAVKDYSLQPVTEQLIGAAIEVHNVLAMDFSNVFINAQCRLKSNREA